MTARMSEQREAPAAALKITDAEWRQFQSIPEQGYSHRAWVDARIAERAADAEQRGADRVAAAVEALIDASPGGRGVSGGYSGAYHDGYRDGMRETQELLRAALTPGAADRVRAEAPPSIDDTCCGKCAGATCYVDQVTGA